MIKLDLNYINVNKKQVAKKYEKKLNLIKNHFVNKNHSMMGWIDYLEHDVFQEELIKIKNYSKEWNKLKINTVVVIGIGGSYIGVKAATDFMSNDNTNIDFIYLSELSSISLNSLNKKLENKNWAIVVISKSGTTLETSINFRITREWLYKKYKNKHNERIVSITDANKGILHDLSIKNGYKTLTIPNDIGGRYSALTSVSLFLMHLKKIDINKVMSGYKNAINNFLINNYQNNFILEYVALRHYFYHQKKLKIEIFQMYDNNYKYITETYKQLFAESECKHKNTIIPVVTILSDDLHSIGQMYQEGPNNFFQTTLFINEQRNFNIAKSSFKNDDNLDYLSNYSINTIKDKLLSSVLKAHTNEANNQNILLVADGNKEEVFGEIYAFLCLAAATSSYLSNVDPFNQPGVENYKKNLKNSL